jgi:hypothetical protein
MCRRPNLGSVSMLVYTGYKAPSWGYINYHFDEEELETTRDTWAAFQPGMKGKGLQLGIRITALKD